METLTGESFLAASGGEPRTRTALLLEAIALRHQIAVLERRELVARAFALGSTVLDLVSRWWPPWRASVLSSSPRRSCAGAVGWSCFGGIDRGVAGAAGARGFPEKSVF